MGRKRRAIAPPRSSKHPRRNIFLGQNILADVFRAQWDLLPKECQDHARELVETMSIDNTFYVSSVCTGTNISFMSTSVMVNIMTDGEMRTADEYCCDLPHKHQWIKFVHCIWGSDECHIYNDVTKMHQNKPQCATCGKGRRLPTKSAVGAAGFTCKNLSKLHAQRKAFRECIRLRSGSTGSTSHGVLDWLREGELPIALLENVKELLNKNSSNWIEHRDMLNDEGFTSAATILRAERQGAQAVRDRAWVLALHRRRLGLIEQEAQKACDDWVQLTAFLQLPPIYSFDDMILADDDPIVIIELENMKRS